MPKKDEIIIVESDFTDSKRKSVGGTICACNKKPFKVLVCLCNVALKFHIGYQGCDYLLPPPK